MDLIRSPDVITWEMIYLLMVQCKTMATAFYLFFITGTVLHFAMYNEGDAPV